MQRIAFKRPAAEKHVDTPSLDAGRRVLVGRKGRRKPRLNCVEFLRRFVFGRKLQAAGTGVEVEWLPDQVERRRRPDGKFGFD